MTQVTLAQLKQMSADEIVAAQDRGDLGDLLRGHDAGRVDATGAPIADTGQAAGEIPGLITDASALKGMTPEQIVQAQQEGRLDRLLGRAPQTDGDAYPGNRG